MTRFRVVKLVRETQDPAQAKGINNTRDEFSSPEYDVSLDGDQLTVKHTATEQEVVLPWTSVLWAAKFPVAVEPTNQATGKKGRTK